ncbi:hypothetical protein HPB51_012944 [Rhipicephalus microplus]|uniref:Uncharacterized protein n=1 Tax=Rhipicephalus microplus TaxID=6941 RepID=A0A9J6F1R9_RHIMP|nr:hypothetical protein HPB51_012944 [Rhipicephalus microplus]
MDAFRRELDAELESELRSGLEPLPAGASGYRGHVTQVYDAVWTAALALRSAELLWGKAKVNLTLSDFRYEKLLPETGGGGSYHWNETVEPPPPPQERRMANYFDRIISRLSFNGLSVSIKPLPFKFSLCRHCADVYARKEGLEEGVINKYVANSTPSFAFTAECGDDE